MSGGGDVYGQQSWANRVTDYDVITDVFDTEEFLQNPTIQLQAQLGIERAEFFAIEFDISPEQEEAEVVTLFVFCKFKYVIYGGSEDGEGEPVEEELIAGRPCKYHNPIFVGGNLDSSNTPAGIVVADVPQSEFDGSPGQGVALWIMIKGVFNDVITNEDDDINPGDWVIPSDDWGVDGVEAGTAPGYKPFGVALSDESEGLVDLKVELD